MKPFNQERALAGDPVMTRDGRPVTQLTLFAANDPDPLIGVIENNVKTWSPQGEYYPGSGTESPSDLFMAPKKYSGWMNLYPSAAGVRAGVLSGELYDTKEIANTFATHNRAACVYLEWEE